jgi:FkbM family methyltransferase
MIIKKEIERIALSVLPKNWHYPSMLTYYKLKGCLEPEFSLLEELIGNGKRVLDVGANIGLYSYVLSNLCDRVESFEPQPWAYNRLKNYQIKNINCHNVGLSDTEGYLDLNIPIINGEEIDGLASFRDLPGEKNTIKVPVHRIDDYNFDDVSFMKIDVEGYEKEVIKGALSTIEKSRPNILVEIEQRHLKEGSIDDVFKWIGDIGYQGYFLENGIVNDIELFSFEKHQQPYFPEIEKFGYSASKNYIHNFFFKPNVNN